VAGGNAVVGQLRDGLRRGVVRIDVPIWLGHIGVRLFGVQGQAQRKHHSGAVGGYVEIAHVAHALGDRSGYVHFGAGRIGLAANVQIPAGDGSNEIARVDVLGEDRPLDVREGEIGDSGRQGLTACNAGRMTARGAAASDHGEQRQRDCREHQTVTVFTQCEDVHIWLPISKFRFSDLPACVRPASLNLIGLIRASSFDAHTHTVNALTEELLHIRFSVHAALDRAGIEVRI